MDFGDLIDLYMTSDIAMITPVRDGMNLVAKEFIATRVDGDGVLILSEMAGASKELHEAVLVNPFDRNAMADAIQKSHCECQLRNKKSATAACKKDSAGIR